MQSNVDGSSAVHACPKHGPCSYALECAVHNAAAIGTIRSRMTTCYDSKLQRQPAAAAQSSTGPPVDSWQHRMHTNLTKNQRQTNGEHALMDRYEQNTLHHQPSIRDRVLLKCAAEHIFARHSSIKAGVQRRPTTGGTMTNRNMNVKVSNGHRSCSMRAKKRAAAASHTVREIS